MSISMRVAFFHQRQRTALGGFGRNVADGKAGGAAGEAAVGDERARLAQALRFEVAGGIQHFLHAGTALGPFVADHHDIAGMDLVAQDGFHCLVLAFQNARGTGEHQTRRIHAGGFDDGTVFRDISVEHRQAAIGD